MPYLIHELLLHSAERVPHRDALIYQDTRLDYATLASDVNRCAAGLLRLGLRRSARVAVYLEKRLETVIAVFGTAAAGSVFVPVNPLLKPDQVAYILKDCNVGILVTSVERLELLAPALGNCQDLDAVVVVGGNPATGALGDVVAVSWDDALSGDGDERG